MISYISFCALFYIKFLIHIVGISLFCRKLAKHCERVGQRSMEMQQVGRFVMMTQGTDWKKKRYKRVESIRGEAISSQLIKIPGETREICFSSICLFSSLTALGSYKTACCATKLGSLCPFLP
jgi:hypothetical protein